MKLLQKKRRRILGSTIAIIFIVSGYFVFISKSEPFQFARQWAKQSQEVRQVVGEIEEIGRFPRSFSYRYNSNRGYARYSFNIQGTRTNSNFYIYLQKEHGDWRVVQARTGEQVVYKQI